MDEKILDALYRKAVGGSVSEVSEEYGAQDELLRRKVTQKYYPPDVAALKAYVELTGGGIAEMSDEELEREKRRLMKEMSCAAEQDQ